MNINGLNLTLFKDDVTAWDIEKALISNGIRRKGIEWNFNKPISFIPMEYISKNWRFYLRQLTSISLTEEELLNANPLYYLNKVLSYRWVNYIIEDLCLYLPIVDSFTKFNQYYQEYEEILFSPLLHPHVEGVLLRELLPYVLNKFNCKIIYFLDSWFNYIEHEVKAGHISNLFIMNAPCKTLIITEKAMIQLNNVHRDRCNSSISITLYISKGTDINSYLNSFISKNGLMLSID